MTTTENTTNRDAALALSHNMHQQNNQATAAAEYATTVNDADNYEAPFLPHSQQTVFGVDNTE